MRYALVILLAAAFVLPSTIADPTLTPQNDAGTGRDAPDQREDALAVPLGHVVFGRVEPVLVASAVTRVLDREDWYAFDIEAGERVLVDLLPVEGEPDGLSFTEYYPLYELRDPTGALAVAGWASFDTPFIAHESGTWTVRVIGYDRPVDYTLNVTANAVSGVSASRTGNGWLLVSYLIGEDGGGVSGRVDTIGRIQEWGPATLCDYRMTPVSTRSNCLRFDDVTPNPGVRVDSTGSTFVLAPPGDAGVRMGMRTGVISQQPGVGHVLAITKASESSATIEITTTGNVTLLDVRRGGEEDLLALRAGDFERGTGAHVGGTGASHVLAHERHVNGTLVAEMGCATIGACSVTGPSGSRMDVGYGWRTLDGAPGTWTFTRDTAIAAGGDGHVLFGADVDFPSG